MSVPESIEPWRSFSCFFSRYCESPLLPKYVCSLWSLVLHTNCGGFTGKETGEHDSATPVTTAPMSGRPVAAPAWSVQLIWSSTVGRNSAAVPTIAKSFWHAVITPSRAALPLSFESMKSTTSLRPAMPPPPSLLFRYLAADRTPSTTPWNSPGTNALSTSASTPILISVALTPISVAFGAPVLDCAPAGATRATTSTTSETVSTVDRHLFTTGPPRSASG